jgi:predicted DNA-binding transcriptional regulator AlpA
MIEKIKKMNFKNYLPPMALDSFFKELNKQNPKVLLRNEILKKTGMPISTFYYRLSTGSFNKRDKKKIAEIIGYSINQLFPDDED